MIPDIPQDLRQEVYLKLKKNYDDALASHKQAQLYADWCAKRVNARYSELLEFTNKYGVYDT